MSVPATAPLPLRVLRSPAGRIVAFFAMLAAFNALLGPVQTLLGIAHGAMDFRRVTVAVMAFRILPAVLAYLLLVFVIERRYPDELGIRKALPHLVLGLAGGAALFSLVAGALHALGAFVVDGVNPGVDWVGPVLVVGVGAGVIEEIVSRGVIFRIVEEGLGTWASLVVSAAVFGGLHLWNPNATAWSALAIGLEAGLLFGLLYHVTRSLWVCMGVHAAWNIAQGPFYGVPVSGFAQQGYLSSHLQGPDWLTGGPFGAEASVVALCICSVATCVCLAVALRHGSLIAPPWRRDPVSG